MDLHLKKLIEKAAEMGIHVEDLSNETGAELFRFSYEDTIKYALGASIFESLSHFGSKIADNKYATKFLLKEAGIPVPPALLFRDVSLAKPEIEHFLLQNTPVVLKPLDGTEGEGICMGISGFDEVNSNWQKIKGQYDQFLLEKQVEGQDLRIQVIGGQLVAACVRVPCTLVGNGISSISELIEERNLFIAKQNPFNHISIDAQVHELMGQAGLELSHILKDGASFQIKKVANMSQGATATDVTAQLHPDYYKWTEQVARLLNMDFFALDAICSLPAERPRADGSGAVCLEINARPGWLHHTFSEGRQHDIARMILENLFPQKRKY